LARREKKSKDVANGSPTKRKEKIKNWAWVGGKQGGSGGEKRKGALGPQTDSKCKKQKKIRAGS